MARQARSGYAALSRCRAWLHRLVDDHAYDEWEEDTGPTSQDLDTTRDPEELIDEMLRDEAQKRSQDDPTTR